MNFGEAIEAVKKGRLVSREGWNGKNMFIFMGFPNVKVYVRTTRHGTTINKDAHDILGCEYSGPVLCIKTAQENIVVGWLASQTDMLANDWIGIKRPVNTGTEHKS